MTGPSWCRLSTPVGVLTLVATDDGLQEIRWSQGRPAGAPPLPDTDEDARHTVLADATAQLGEYFAAERRRFDLPLAPRGTEFQLRAWEALRQIPFGEVRTYAEQAAILGRPTAARAVGAANARNPLPIVVPCHRVIGADGTLTGFAGGLDAKRWLLEHERSHSGPLAGRTMALWGQG